MRVLLQPLLFLLGLILLVFGGLGFIMNPLFGTFATDPIHNLLHLITGFVAVRMSRRDEHTARMYLLGFGILYSVVSAIGFLIVDPIPGYLSVNLADNYFHIAITAVCFLVGITAEPRAKPKPPIHSYPSY